MRVSRDQPAAVQEVEEENEPKGYSRPPHGEEISCILASSLRSLLTETVKMRKDVTDLELHAAVRDVVT